MREHRREHVRGLDDEKTEQALLGSEQMRALALRVAEAAGDLLEVVPDIVEVYPIVHEQRRELHIERSTEPQDLAEEVGCVLLPAAVFQDCAEVVERGVGGPRL